MPAKLERCVAKVKKSGKVKSPFAVCVASLQKSGDLPKGKKHD